MEEPIMSEKEVAPATGDEQNVRFYLAIVAVAVGVIILTKRQIEEQLHKYSIKIIYIPLVFQGKRDKI